MEYVAFLRGIMPMNPNMRNEKLRGVFEKLGYTNVRSFLSSGNILFESNKRSMAKLERTIEEGLSEHLDIESSTIIRSADQIRHLVASRPFGQREHNRKTYLTITFLKNEPRVKPKPLNSDKGFELLGYDAANRAIFAVTDTTIASTPDLMGVLEKKYGKEITTRTWKTVERIEKKLLS